MEPWLLVCHISFYFLLYISSAISSSPYRFSYTEHCGSVILESTLTGLKLSPFRRPTLQNAYYYYADEDFDHKSSDSSWPQNKVSFIVQNAHETRTLGDYKVEAGLNFKGIDMENFLGEAASQGLNNGERKKIHLRGMGVSFSFHGFWSEHTGKLCMLGKNNRHNQAGTFPELNALLKLNFLNTSNRFTGFVKGTLESLGSSNGENHFDKIVLLAFPQKNQQNSMISDLNVPGCPAVSNEPMGMTWLSLDPSHTICSALFGSRNTIQLKHYMNCDSSKNCDRFDAKFGLPLHFVSLIRIHCSDRYRLRLLLGFSNSSLSPSTQPFNPYTTLIGDGVWDEENNQLCVIACRVLDLGASSENMRVRDCSFMFILRFPAILTIKRTSNIVGQLWTYGGTNNSGTEGAAMLKGEENSMVGFSGIKYEYTQLHRVKNLCRPIKTSTEKRGTYPDPYSFDMSFEFFLKKSTVDVALGSLILFSVGDQIYNESSLQPILKPKGAEEVSSRVNISYMVTFMLLPSAELAALVSLSNNILGGSKRAVEISAEGIYDVETGGLCMVGCRKSDLNTSDEADCDTAINLQFPHFDAKNGGQITGRIESTRKASDPLYFESLELSSKPFYPFQEEKTARRIRFQISVVPYPNTLLWIFIRSQLLHLRRETSAIPYLSLAMLFNLTLGHIMPLVLDFAALLVQDHWWSHFVGIAEWLDHVKELALRIISMAAFLFILHLFHLACRARSRHRSQKTVWEAEKKSVYTYSLLCLSGGLVTSFLSHKRIGCNPFSIPFSNGLHHETPWWGRRICGGLLADGFLLPQILLNIFLNTTEKTLVPSFYVGITVVRMVQHASEFYREKSYGNHVEASHPTYWSAIVPALNVLPAVVIYLQQRFGGRCFIPRRFK